ncbi:MAG: serine/threonine-protein kinase [Byssovorax sp.]
MIAGKPTPSAETVRPGDILAGKYRVERILGSGGTGVVVAAVHVAQGHRVALKLLLPAAMADAEVVGRFLREARASLSLRSPHVARIYEVGTLEAPLGTHYMVMEHLDGTDLRALVRRGPLRVDEAVGYVLQACSAIAEAHQLGIIHRDLKPENLFLTRLSDGAPLIKVLDFGISKMPLSGAEMQLTQSATVMGTPHYMAPEQMRSMKNVTARSDIWGMGAVLYELISARRAFSGQSITEICTQVLLQPPPPLPEAPPELGAVVMRCLEKDPQKRFASMSELGAALSPFTRLSPAPLPGAAPAQPIVAQPIAAARGPSQPPPPPDARPSWTGPAAPSQDARPSWTGPSQVGLPAPAAILGPAAQPQGVAPMPPGPAAGPALSARSGGSLLPWIVIGALAVFVLAALVLLLVLRRT